MPRLVSPRALAVAAVLGACASPGSPAPAAPPAPATPSRDTVPRVRATPAAATAATPMAPPLPAMPVVAGSLAIHVVYPAAHQLITSSDSTFVLGSVGNGNATLTIDGTPARVYPNGAFMAFVANPPASDPQYTLVATLGADTARTTHSVRVRVPGGTHREAPPPDTAGKWVRLDDPASSIDDTDATIVARPTPGETYHWFFLPGTVVWRDRSANGYTRLRVDRELSVWVPDSLAHDVDSSAPPPHRVAGDGDVISAPGWDDFVLPTGNRPAYFVAEGDRALQLTLYDTRGNTDIIRYPARDSLIRRIDWEQVDDDRVRYTLHLDQQPFGYLVLWDHGKLVFRVRRAPPIDPTHPLRGRVIAIDPGHPPAGATGPTGLYEGDAVLAVARRLEPMLEAAGATVIMTRTSRGPVPLEDRPDIARQAGAEAFVSIHLNAFPDGVNPFTATEGSATYYFAQQSAPLARAVQTGLVRTLGLPDQGIVFRSLAVVRQTWLPSVLCEGAFVIVPQQEAALRTAAFQQQYARGIFEGLAAYFRAMGAAK